MLNSMEDRLSFYLIRKTDYPVYYPVEHVSQLSYCTKIKRNNLN